MFYLCGSAQIIAAALLPGKLRSGAPATLAGKWRCIAHLQGKKNPR
jgi:hypothetical protein